MAEPIKITIKGKGRFKQPKLDAGQLQHIGEDMVTTQKARWASAVNALGGKAKPLSKKYTFIKAKVRRTNRPVRDMRLTGTVLSNFRLRKAINGVIRAEPTSRIARDKARGADRYEQMIGFSGTDIKNVYDEVQKAYGELAKTLWYQAK